MKTVPCWKLMKTEWNGKLNSVLKSEWSHCLYLQCIHNHTITMHEHTILV